MVRERMQRCVDADAQEGRRIAAFAPNVVQPALHGTRTCDAVRETGAERMQMTIDVNKTLLRQAADWR